MSLRSIWRTAVAIARDSDSTDIIMENIVGIGAIVGFSTIFSLATRGDATLAVPAAGGVGLVMTMAKATLGYINVKS